MEVFSLPAGGAALPPPIATSTPRVSNNTTQNGYPEPPTPQWKAGQTARVRDSATSVTTGVSVTTTETRPSSTSSELTQISTTDISSHADEIDHVPLGSEDLNTNMNNASEIARPKEPPKLGTAESSGSSPKSLALSDVVVAVGSTTVVDTTSHPEMADSTLIRRESVSSDEPPPPPLSPPPGEEDHEEGSGGEGEKMCSWKWCMDIGIEV